MNNGFENFEDMKKMQQDAIRRTHEMNMRAKKISHGEPGNEQHHVEVENEKENPEPQKEKHEHHKEKEHHKHKDKPKIDSEPPFNILDNLFSDPEKSLILILIFIFLDEDTNPMLIMALMYLLM